MSFLLLNNIHFRMIQRIFCEVKCDNSIQGLYADLYSISHCHLQEELAIPQLGQITTLLKGLCYATTKHH